MAEHERDARVSGAYRGLGREEPPPELDAAILAASRRRRSRWAVPVSVAAVVVLAVGVTLRVQMEERKGAEEITLSPQVMQAPPSAAAPARQEVRDAAPPVPRSAPRAREAAPGADAPQVGAVRGLDASGQMSGRPESAEPAARASAGVAVGKITAAPQTPEQWLERIARLRDAGKAREADESLAEFRKRYPDYRISEAMRARVAPR
jgi:hypothetical protein